MPTAILTVTNDLVADQRVHRIAITLQELGFEVMVVGRFLKNSAPLNRRYKTLRFRLTFNKSWLFYANYNIRLFFYLLFKKKYDLVVANDLDTLAAGLIAAKIRCKPVVFDAHEYFTQVPELIHKPFIKKTWLLIEKLFVPHVAKAYTVCDSLAHIYSNRYKKPFHVIRNLPYKIKTNDEKILKSRYPGKNIIVYQGAVNIGRGLDLVIEAMRYIENAVFVIIGDGDVKPVLEKQVHENNMQGKVHFTGRIGFENLPAYTESADVGISLEDDMGLNYRYALPNKIFDYIQAQVPVLVSDLPEMKAIVEKFEVGMVLKHRTAEKLAGLVNEMINNQTLRKQWNRNLQKAAAELCWENEKTKLVDIYKPFI